MKEITLEQAEQVSGGLAPFLIMIGAMALATLFGAEDGNGSKFWQF